MNPLPQTKTYNVFPLFFTCRNQTPYQIIPDADDEEHGNDETAGEHHT
jgi:hypothetical protein